VIIQNKYKDMKFKTYQGFNTSLKNSVIFAIVFGSIQFLGAAHSQSLTYPKVTETYFGANAMFGMVNRVDDLKGSGNFNGDKVDKPGSLMVRWGYREEQQYSLELGYMYILDWSGTSNSGAKISQESQGFFADLFFFFPITQQASIYLKAGAARLQTTGTINLANTTNYKATETKWGPTYGVGVEYLINPSFAIRGGWETIKVRPGGSLNHSEQGGVNLTGILFYE